MGFGFERKDGISKHRRGAVAALTQGLSTYTEPHVNATFECSGPSWADTKCSALL